MNIALILSYDGTNYNGWQVQKNGPSIQESMETAVFRLLGQKAHVSGVGRTDSGVHARRYVASFRANCTIPMARLPDALNSFLPDDIAVSGAAAVPESFDARFDCTKKEYAYYIYPSALRDPFHARYAYRYHVPARPCENAAGRAALCRQAGLCCRAQPGYASQKHGARPCSGARSSRWAGSSASASAATGSCTTWCAPSQARWPMWAAGS